MVIYKSPSSTFNNKRPSTFNNKRFRSPECSMEPSIKLKRMALEIQEPRFVPGDAALGGEGGTGEAGKGKIQIARRLLICRTVK
jgi:hypothetical protein